MCTQGGGNPANTSPTTSLKVPGNSSDLRRFAIRVTQPPVGSTVLFSGSAAGRLRAPYSFEIYRIDDGPPELADQNIVFNSIVTEPIRAEGDVDDFLFDGTVGTSLMVRLEPQPDWSSLPLVATISDLTSGSVLERIESQGGNTVSSVRLRPVNDGPHRVRVEHRNWEPGTADGSYRLGVYSTSLGGEGGASLLPDGVLITSEGVDVLGDIDEFYFDADSGDIAGLYAIESGQNSIGKFRTYVTAPSGRRVFWMDNEGLSRSGSPLSETGRYAVTVQQDEWPVATPSDTGRYEIRFDRATHGPETVATAMALGDVIDTELLDVLADVDTFNLTVAAPTQAAGWFQLIDGCIDGLGQCGWIGLSVIDRVDGNEIVASYVDGADARRMVIPRRFTLPRADSYAVQVRANPNINWDVASWPSPNGRYSMSMVAVDPTPETASVNYVLGTLVDTEDFVIGDIDTFAFSTGAEDVIAVDVTVPNTGWGQLKWKVTDESGNIYGGNYMVDYNTGWGLRIDAVPFTNYTLYLGSEDLAGYINWGSIGPYSFTIHSIDRTPEVAASAIAVGDTVITESIDMLFDVDEFAVPLMSGDTIVVSLDLSDPSGGDGIWFTVEDTTGTSIGNSRNVAAGAQGSASFSAPSTGTFKVVIGYSVGRYVGPYTVSVTR